MDSIKRELAIYCADKFLKSGSVIGVGTGSTVAFFIDILKEKISSGKVSNVKLFCSSVDTEYKLSKLGVDFLDTNFLAQYDSLDFYFDGADEFDSNCFLIKGGGGALLREKILCNFSKMNIIMADKTKKVEKLGLKFPIPIEIDRWAFRTTEKNISNLVKTTSLRTSKNKMGFEYTDNSNMIVDVVAYEENYDIISLNNSIQKIPGVVETGLFIDYSGVIVYGDGNNIQEFVKK